MQKRLFLKKNIYFLLFGICLIVVAAAGIISPLIVNHIKSDWEDLLSSKTNRIETRVITAYKNIEDGLLGTLTGVKSGIRKLAASGDLNKRELLNFLTRKDLNDFSILITMNGGDLRLDILHCDRYFPVSGY